MNHSTIIDIMLFAFLLISVYTDIFYRKVFNFTSFPAIILGIGFNLLFFGLPGLKDSLAGFAAGFLCLFVFYLLGGIGAGDVKFMAAVGALKGFDFTLMGFLYGAAVGGAAAIAVMLINRRFISGIKKIFFALLGFLTFKTPGSLKLENEKAIFLPYSVFLSIGIFLRWLEMHFK